MGFKYELRLADGDDAGTLEHAVPNPVDELRQPSGANRAVTR